MMDPMTKLTEHFTLKEMTASAKHPEIYNVPPLEVIDNIKRVCEWLEDLRLLYNRRYGGAGVRGCENSASAKGNLVPPASQEAAPPNHRTTGQWHPRTPEPPKTNHLKTNDYETEEQNC